MNISSLPNGLFSSRKERKHLLMSSRSRWSVLTINVCLFRIFNKMDSYQLGFNLHVKMHFGLFSIARILISLIFFIVQNTPRMDMTEFHSPLENLECSQFSLLQTVMQSTPVSIRLSLHSFLVYLEDKFLVELLVKE